MQVLPKILNIILCLIFYILKSSAKPQMNNNPPQNQPQYNNQQPQMNGQPYNSQQPNPGQGQGYPENPQQGQMNPNQNQGQYYPQQEQQGHYPEGTFSTTTSSTTTTTTTVNPGGYPVTQPLSEEETSTSTIFDGGRASLNVSSKPYQPPDECINFHVRTLLPECCTLPKLIIPHNVTEKCQNVCKNSTESYCCMIKCKFETMKIFNAPSFNPNALVAAYSMSLRNISNELKNLWVQTLSRSIQYCYYDQNSKETTPPIPSTTTDRTKYLMNNAVQQGQGYYVDQQSETSPVNMPTETTIALAVRQQNNIFCGIPVYMYRIIACTKVQNFFNCPKFNKTATACQAKWSVIKKCGNELNYTN